MAKKTPEELQRQIEEQFPDYAYIGKLFPEIQNLMLASLQTEGTDYEWSSLEFDSKLRQTNWWRSRSAQARNWDTEGERDPGERARRVGLRTQSIQQKAAAYGVTISQTDLDRYVEDSLRWGYTDTEVNALVLSSGTAGEFGAGSIAVDASEISALGRDYITTISDREAQEWAVRIAKGTATLDSVRSMLSSQAKQAFPQFAASLEDGFSIRESTSTLRSYVGNVLEISPDEIDLNNDRWSDLIDQVDDNGNQRTMTRSEAGRWSRKQAEYKGTIQSKGLAANVVSAVGEAFGRIA